MGAVCLSPSLSLLLSSYLYGSYLFYTPFLFVRGLPLSLSLTLFLFVRGLPLLLFEYMGYLLCLYHSFLLFLFLFMRALDPAVTAAIKPILEHILEMNSLT
jgi:hypothetical protein